jgi:hypothetical protein
MPEDPPQLSDDEFLAEIFLLGEEASNVALCKALERHAGVEVKRDYVDERLRRLRAAGLVTFAPSLGAWSLSAARPVRLTAHGVERLRALQREPVAPRTV